MNAGNKGSDGGNERQRDANPHSQYEPQSTAAGTRETCRTLPVIFFREKYPLR